MKTFRGFLLLLLAMGGFMSHSPWNVQAQGQRELYMFTTLAGTPETGPGAIDGLGSAARFNNPSGVAVDTLGSLYVADTGNHTVRKILPDGTVQTLAGLAETAGSADGQGASARFNSPSGIAVDRAGNVYAADTGNFTLRKITPDRVVTTLAGLAGQSGNVDGTGSAARFSWPELVAVDDSGTIYVAEGFAIRKVTPDGVVTTLAGRVDSPGTSDGAGTAARFKGFCSLAVDAAGDLYAADCGSHTIRKVTAAGVVTTVAGVIGSTQPADGAGRAARFIGPSGLAVGGSGDIFVVDYSLIRKMTPDGVVSTLLDMSTFGNLGLNSGRSLAVDAAGNMYVADTWSHRVGKVTPDREVTIVAGCARTWAPGVDGPASVARFNGPHGLSLDPAGSLYVADGGMIRKVAPGGLVTTLAGSAEVWGSEDGTGGAAQFGGANSVAADNSGNVYVADTGNSIIRKVTPHGVVTTFAGQAGATGSADGVGKSARFACPYGVAVDSSGVVYVSDTDNRTIRKMLPDGTVTTLAGKAGAWGSADGSGSAARFACPWGLAVDKAGNVYVADEQNHTIRKVTPEGIVTTLAGLAENQGSADGAGREARFSGPRGIAVDFAGNVYVTETWGYTIRKITPDGVVTTIGGQGGKIGSVDGAGSEARFGGGFDAPGPSGIAADAAGNVYVADTFNGTIRFGSVHVCPDQPVLDWAVAPAGQARQLDTLPQSAAAWQWTLIRQPAGSTASISEAGVRNPTFTPDIADLYVFRLKASTAAGATGVRTLRLSALPASAVVFSSSQRFSKGCFQSAFLAQANESYTLQVSKDLRTWLDWTNVTCQSLSSALTDPGAGAERCRFYRARKN